MTRIFEIGNLTNMTELYPFLESNKWYLLFRGSCSHVTSWWKPSIVFFCDVHYYNTVLWYVTDSIACFFSFFLFFAQHRNCLMQFFAWRAKRTSAQEGMSRQAVLKKMHAAVRLVMTRQAHLQYITKMITKKRLVKLYRSNNLLGSVALDFSNSIPTFQISILYEIIRLEWKGCWDRAH